MNERKESTDDCLSEGSGARERRRDWRDLYDPESSATCQRNPFVCGCLVVNFESKGKRERQERRARELEAQETDRGGKLWRRKGGNGQGDQSGI